MHEMTLAVELLKLAEESARSKGCRRIKRVVVHCGQLSGVLPDALDLAFQCLVADTPHADAKLEVIIIPLKLRCPFCGHIFMGADREAIYGPCPHCNEEFAHIVEEGTELLLAGIEAES